MSNNVFVVMAKIVTAVFAFVFTLVSVVIRLLVCEPLLLFAGVLSWEEYCSFWMQTVDGFKKGNGGNEGFIEIPGLGK